MDTKKGRQHSGFAALLLDSIYYLVVSYGLECFLLSFGYRSMISRKAWSRSALICSNPVSPASR